MRTDPPRLAIWLLTRRLSAEWRDFALGDLEEEFGVRSADSASAARAWFWWQAIRCLVAPPPVRRESLPLQPSPGDSTMRTFLADLRYALRVMARTPSFAVAVVSVLAVGIGANTAIFSIVNSVLLRPLPFEEPERLVRLFHTPPQNAFPGEATFPLSPANFYDWQRAAQSFEGMAMYVLRLVIVEGMSPALVGIAAGTIAALALARLMETLVFGVSASDPLTLAVVASTLAFVALIASLVPAYRASRLDPLRVLRAD